MLEFPYEKILDQLTLPEKIKLKCTFKIMHQATKTLLFLISQSIIVHIQDHDPFSSNPPHELDNGGRTSFETHEEQHGAEQKLLT